MSRKSGQRWASVADKFSNRTSRNEAQNFEISPITDRSSSGSEPEIVDDTRPLMKRLSSQQLLKDLNQGKTDEWDPELCVQLIRIPSITNYSGVRKLVERSSPEWVREFLFRDGLGLLFESLEKLSSRGTSSISEAILLLEAVLAVRSVINSKAGIDYLLSNVRYTRQLVKALGNKNPMVKKQIFELFSAISVYSNEGHVATIDALDFFKVTNSKHDYRCSIIISELKSDESATYKSSVLGFANCLILGADKARLRFAVRSELIGLGILELLAELRLTSEDEELCIQIDAFDNSRLEDEDDIQLSEEKSLHDLFQEIFIKVKDTPYNFTLHSVLFNLCKLDMDSPNTSGLWSLLEEITSAALHGGNLNVNQYATLTVDSNAQQNENEIVPKLLQDAVDDSRARHTENSHSSDSALNVVERQSTIKPSSTKSQVTNGIKKLNISDTAISCETASPSSSLVSPPPPPPPLAQKPAHVTSLSPPPPPLPPCPIAGSNSGSPPPLPPPLPHLAVGAPVPPPLPPSTSRGTLPPPPPPPPPPFNAIAGILPPPPPPPPFTGNGPPLAPPMAPPPPPSNTAFRAPMPPGTPPILPATAVANKPKTRTLNWTKFNPNQLKNESMWQDIHKTLSSNPPVSIRHDRIWELFGLNKESNTSPANSPVAKKVSSEISLLDNKRSLSLNLMLKQFKCTQAQLMEKLRTGEIRDLGVEKLRLLEKNLPDSEEFALVRNYDGDVNKLGSAEQFLYNLIAIPHFRLRIEGMVLKEEFSPIVDTLRSQLTLVLDTIAKLKGSNSMKDFFAVILLHGNALNAGSYAGNAAGFKLSVLPRLVDLRANKPRVTLLHYIVEVTQNENPELLTFVDEFESLKDVSRISIEGLQTELRQISTRVINVANPMKEIPDPYLKALFESFITSAMSTCHELQTLLLNIQTASAKLAIHFSEDPEKFSLEEIMGVFVDFIDKENEVRQRQEARAAKLAAEKKACAVETGVDKVDGKVLRRNTSKDQREVGNATEEDCAIQRPKKSSYALYEAQREVCVVDRLLADIRRGDFQLRNASRA